MKSPKQMSPEELVEAAQIGKLLVTTATNAGRTRSEPRSAAAQWWREKLADIITKNFTGSER